MRACRQIAATPASSAMRPMSRKVRCWSSIPILVLTVTGTPWRSAARTVLVMIARTRSSFQGRTPPPPLRVTFGTGQPKLRSTWATPNSAHRMVVARAMMSITEIVYNNEVFFSISITEFEMFGTALIAA